jgi:thymidylate synthase (FAD)
MKIIEPHYTIETPIDGDALLTHLEKAGRTCYKSEDKITSESAKSFVKKLITMGHESVIEHFSITVRFVCDRGVSHELVRHRLASFSQESTRYCNYGKADEITVIQPPFFDFGTPAYTRWCDAMYATEHCYLSLIRIGRTPQEARSVLPNSLKTEIVVTANLREWRTILKQRTSPAAHPQMRQLMEPLLRELKERIPIVFDDILNGKET